MFLIEQKGYDVTYFHMNWQAYRLGSSSYSPIIGSSSLRLNSPCFPSLAVIIVYYIIASFFGISQINQYVLPL